MCEAACSSAWHADCKWLQWCSKQACVPPLVPGLKDVHAEACLHGAHNAVRLTSRRLRRRACSHAGIFLLTPAHVLLANDDVTALQHVRIRAIASLQSSLVLNCCSATVATSVHADLSCRSAAGAGGIAPAALAGEKPFAIAHRGSSGALPEHTVEAYSLAVEQDADFIECDVVLTKDRRAPRACAVK
jgi:Glycerophosphoryl diester phosphodiesterase family